MAAFVYLATNRINGKRYVGVTSHGLAFRRRQHENSPNVKRVTCRYFHAAMKKYGSEAFEWATLVSCETFEEALREEIRLITEVKPEYNLTAGGQGVKGRVVSQAQRDHHSRVMKGRKKPPEFGEKIRLYQLGRKRDPKTGQKISAKRLGMKFSAEHCRRISLGRTGIKSSPEAIEKRRQKALGRPCSQEHREKIRATLTGRKRPPEVVAKMLASRAIRYAAKPWLDLGITYSCWSQRRRKARQEAAHGVL